MSFNRVPWVGCSAWWEMQKSGPGDRLVWCIYIPFVSLDLFSSLHWTLGGEQVLTTLIASNWVQPMWGTNRRLEGRNSVRLGCLFPPAPILPVHCGLASTEDQCSWHAALFTQQSPGPSNQLPASPPQAWGRKSGTTREYLTNPHAQFLTTFLCLPKPLWNSPQIAHWNLSSVSCRDSERYWGHA